MKEPYESRCGAAAASIGSPIPAGAAWRPADIPSMASVRLLSAARPGDTPIAASARSFPARCSRSTPATRSTGTRRPARASNNAAAGPNDAQRGLQRPLTDGERVIRPPGRCLNRTRQGVSPAIQGKTAVTGHHARRLEQRARGGPAPLFFCVGRLRSRCLPVCKAV